MTAGRLLAVAGAAVVVTAAAVWPVVSSDGCGRPRVAASPEIAPAVRELLGRRCAGARVVAVPAADVRPADHDVWIPDSAAWLQGPHASFRVLVPSLARTSLVPAMSSALAVKRPRTPTGWDDVFRWVDPARRDAVPVRIMPPERDAAALGVLRVAERLRARREVSGDTRFDLLQGLKTSPAVLFHPKPALALTSEQQVWLHNRDHPDERVEPIYPTSPFPAELNFPVVVTAPERVHTGPLREALVGERAVRAVQRVALRSPDGERGAGFGDSSPAVRRAGPDPTAPPPGATLEPWRRLTAPHRFLALLDASTPTALRAQVRTLTGWVGLMPGGTTFGLWPQEGPAPGPLGEGREAAFEALFGVRASPTGGSSLDESLLDALRRARRDHTPGQTSVLLVLSDRGDDALDGSQLVETVRREHDPRRPVAIHVVGPSGALGALARVTGGGVHLTGDRDAYLRVLGIPE